MNSRKARQPILITTIAVLAGWAFSTASFAANLHWDGGGTDILTNGNGISDGGAGTWDTALLNWDAGAVPHVAWSDANLDTAIFGGTAGAVVLGANISAGGLRFHTTGYTLDTGANTLTLGGADTAIRFSRAAAATITGAIGGTGNVSISFINPTTGIAVTPSTLTLNGTSSGGWSGVTTLNALTTTALAGSNQALLNVSGIVLNGGGITLTNTDAAQAALDRVSNSAAITAQGGTVAFANTSGANVYAESLGSVALASGQTNFVLTTNQTGAGNQTLTLAGLTRAGAANLSAVTFSAGVTSPQAAGGKNLIVVTGAGSTTAGQILGPWATTGTDANTQTDYAIFNSDHVVPAAIASSAETAWTTPAQAYSLDTGSLVTLGATRTVAALRFLGATSTLSTGANALETYGLLFSGANAKTVASDAGGALTTPAGGGALYITAGRSGVVHTISATIADNGGAVSVVKSGAGTLALTGTNTFTGNLVINAGIVNAALAASIGGTAPVIFNGSATFNTGTVTYNRGITINNGALLQFGNSNPIFTGDVTGTGGFATTSSFGSQVTLSGTGNTFEGPIIIGVGSGTTGQAYRAVVASLADSATANGRIIFLPSSVTHADGSVFHYTGTSNLVLNNRQLELASVTASPINGHQLRNTGTGTLTVNTDLLVSTTAPQTLNLTGTNTGANAFNGNIANGPSTAIGLTKSSTGNWSLSGTNTYTGVTTMGFANPSGNLTFQGIQALSPSTAFVQTHIGGIGGFGTFKVLDDAATPASRSGVNLTLNASNTTNTMTLFVGNNHTANGGTSAGTTTGSTIQLGNLTFNQTAAGNTSQTLAVTGANAYRLRLGNVTPTLLATAGAWSAIFSPTTAPMTIAGNVQQAGNGSAGTVLLQLAGTALDNEITGNILDSADATAKVLSLTKTNSVSTWTLAGTNAYTGPTIVNGGTLLVSGSLSGASVVTVNPGGTLGGSGTIGGATTLANGGKLSPGTLTFGSSLNLSAVSTPASLAFELGTASDRVTLSSGALQIGSGTLGFSEFAFSDSGGLAAGTYTLFDTTTPISGVLDPADLSGNFGAFSGTLDFADGGNDLVLTVVPEPSSFALLGLGALGLLRRRRSK